MYCRLSMQILQAGGGASVGACWVPQVVQMKASMAILCEHRYDSPATESSALACLGEAPD
jgi:hypothetical protein